MNCRWRKVKGDTEIDVVEDGRIQQVGGSLLIRQVTSKDAAK